MRFTHLVRLRTIGLFCSLIRREEHRPSEHASVNVCLTYEPSSTWGSWLHMSGLHPQDRLLVLRSSLLSSPRNVEQKRDCLQSTTWPATVQIFDENKRNCLHKKNSLTFVTWNGTPTLPLLYCFGTLVLLPCHARTRYTLYRPPRF